jgi:integrase
VPWVFHHRGGRPVAETTLRGWWRDAATRAGYPGVVFHDLRRSGIRNMIRAGVSEPVAMSISGHRSVGIFRRYNITTTADQRQALIKTDEYVETRRASTLTKSKGRR